MWSMMSHVLASLIEATSGSKGRIILWNERIEVYFKDINHMVSYETLLNQPDWKILFILNTDDFNKQLGDIISQHNQKISFFNKISSKPQYNYNTTEK